MEVIETINRTLFLWINAPAHPDAATVFMATFFAEYLIWLVPLLLLTGWLRGTEPTRRIALEAATAGMCALAVNQVIGLIWQHPRPFMIGLGHTLLDHVADSSFPSDHLTLLWAVAFSFLLRPALRRTGVILSLLGLPVAWARIYLGVHFPLDMLGAALVALVSATLCLQLEPRLQGRIFQPLQMVYRYLFSPLIARGWVRK